jgi:hypothetical protein
MRKSLMALAAVLVLAGCGGEKTVYSDAEGNEVKVTREGRWRGFRGQDYQRRRFRHREYQQRGRRCQAAVSGWRSIRVPRCFRP